MTLETSVIIPSWNGLHLLKISLPSLDRQTYKNFEVIIIDNGSVDGSVDYIEKRFSDFKVIKLEKNIGFAPAVNMGIKQAKGKFIVLINNDTRVDKNCLKFLVGAAKAHEDVGMVAAKMLNFLNPKIIDSAGDCIDAVGHASNIGFGQKDDIRFNEPKYIFLTTGGGSLIKREVFDRIGLFDDDYFAYFEDVDFCLRAQFIGFKIWYEPKAVIYHMHKATSSRNWKLTEYLQFRNMTQTIIKDFPKALLLSDLNLIKIVLVNINTIRFLATQGLLREALMAELYIITHLFTILRKRQKIQRSIKVSDKYIIKNFVEKKITFFGLLKNGI